MSDPNENPARSRRRRKRKSYALLILAAGILAFGVAAGTLYYVLRPTTLRIAVGPAGSDDQKLIQVMAQTFARDGSPVRLSPITTEGTAESIALFTRRQGRPCGRARRSEPAGQCRSRSPSCARTSSCCGRRPAFRPRARRNSRRRRSRARRSRRPPRRRDRTDAGQRHAAARDPEGVRHQSRQGDGQPVRHQPDRRDGARPVARRLHGGRPAREQDHRGRDRGDGGGPRRAEIPADRRFGGDREEAPALRIRGNSRQHLQLLAARGRKTRSTPSASIT